MTSCATSEVEPDLTRLGHDYFPMKVGMFRVYDMDETTHRILGPERRRFQMRETVVDSIVLSGSEVRYTLHRETRSDDEGVWSLDSVWTARVSTQRAIVTENNVQFIKMVFPIENELEWDANAYNSRNFEYYRYDNTTRDTTFFENQYDDLWRVYHGPNLEENFLGWNSRSEIYARNVGLIHKSVHIWNYCQQGCSSEKQIVAGRDLTQVLIEYGED